VPQRAQIAYPLHYLTGGGGKKGKRHKPRRVTANRWEWTDDYEAAFIKLKSALTGEPVLGYPNFKQSCILEIGASFFGLGAVLPKSKMGR